MSLGPPGVSRQVQGLTVFNRIRGLFARYADRHLAITGRGAALPEVDGARLGYVESTVIHGNRIQFNGWTTADQIVLSWHGGQLVQRPHLNRADVAAALGVDPEVGFSVGAPLSLGPFELTLRQGNAEYQCRLRTPSAVKQALARMWLGLRFARVLLRASPSILKWQATKDPLHRARIKAILDLDAHPVAGPMHTNLFDDGHAPPAGLGETPITIVLPVYNAFDLLPDVLDRVERHTDLPWQLAVIEDKSPDPRVRPFLRDWASSRRDRVHLIENDANLGFIKSVNKGLEYALKRGAHVVLLNSDALVPEAWASRLIAPLVGQENVATVTPMSNDAEIFSVPAICTKTDLKPGEADAIDTLARQFHPQADLEQAPTGVGFCMAMNIAFLRRLPTLDTAFGRGYGEEVDWCRKAHALGGLHLGLAGLFVEHKGGESFGSAEKQDLVQKNNELVASRYPTYDREVQEFIQADPMITARIALALAFVAVRSPGPVPVYLAHSLGGGAEHYLLNRIHNELQQGQSSVVVRVGGPQRFQVEVRTPDGESTGTTDDFDFLKRLLDVLPQRRIIYSCGVGDADPIELPALLRRLVRRADDRQDALEVLVHDYFPISPSYCLLDSDGVFRGPVLPDRSDRAHMARRPDRTRTTLADWQKEWGQLIDAADQVTVFSESSRSLVLATYPGAEPVLRVVPHSLAQPVPLVETGNADVEVIGILGNIGLQKGAAVAQDLARMAESRGDFRLALIGNIDPAFSLPRSVPVHGNYHVTELDSLATKYGITRWLIPSIWPETFSYTTHECIATGLPVYAFDIGAQGDAVRNAANGHVIEFSAEDNLAQSILRQALDRE